MLCNHKLCILTIFLISLSLLTCSEEPEADTEWVADLSISVSPNPVPFSYYDDVSDTYYWQGYKLVFEEHRGYPFGATFKSWTREYYRSAYFLESVEEFTSEWFISQTQECDVHNGSISGGGKLCGTFTEELQAPDPDMVDGWFVIDRITFVDWGWDQDLVVTQTINFMPADYN